LPGGSQQNTTPAQFAARLQQAAQAEAQRSTPAPKTSAPSSTPKPAGPRATPPSQMIPSWLPDWYRSMWQNQYPQTSSVSQNDNSVTIAGDIHIHTAATDSQAIAREIHGAIADQMIAQSNTGLS